MTQDLGFRLSVSGQAQVVGAMGDVERAIGNAAGALRALAGAMGAGLSLKAAIDAADAVTTLHNSLRLATGSAQAAGAAYERLFQIAQATRTSFTDLGGTFSSIARATQSLGLSQERLLNVTQAIGNAMTISGGSADSMRDALRQLGQGLASGTLRGDELNSVLEQTPRLAQALADGLGVGIGELRKLGEAGSLTAEQVITALEKSAPQLAKEVQGATLTVGQAFTVLSNSAIKFVGEADRATGASATLAGAMQSLGAAIDTAGGFIRKHEAAITVIAGTLAGAATVAGITAVVARVGGLAGAIGLVTKAWGALNLVMTANPAGLALLGIGAVAGGIMAANSAVANSAAGMAHEIESLTQRIATAQKTLDATSSRGELTRGLQERLEAMRQRRAELQQALAADQAAGLDTRAEDARLQRSAQRYAQEQQSLKDLAEIRQKLSGVDKDYLPTLEKLNTARQLGTISEKDYVAQVTELAKQTYKASDEEKKAAQAAEQNKERVKSLMEATDAKLAVGQLELQQLRDNDGTQQQLTKAQEYALGVLEKLRAGEVKLTTAQAARLSVKLEQLDADEHAKQQLERDAKWSQQAADESARAIEAAQQHANSLQEQAKRQQEANEAIGLSAVAVADLEAARQRDAAASKEQLAAAIETASPKLAQAYREQAQGLRDLADAKQLGAVKQQQADAAKAYVDGLKQAIDQAGQSLSDSLMQGGRGAGKQLVRYFETLTVRMGVQAFFVQPLQSALGVAQTAGGSPGAAGYINAASSGYNLYNAASSAWTLGSQYAAGTMSAANVGGTLYANATASMYGDGLSALLATNGAYGTAAGASGAAAGSAAAAEGASAAGAAGSGSSLMSSFSAAGPYAIAALVIANALGLFKSTKRVGGGLLGTVGDVTSVQAYDLMRESGSLFSGPDYSYNTHAADPALVQAISAGVGAVLSSTRAQAGAIGVGGNISYFSGTLGTDTIHPDTGGTGIKLDGLTAEQAQQKVAAAVAALAEKAAVQALGPAGEALARSGETAVQTLSRLSSGIASVNSVMHALGESALEASLDGASAAQRLTDAFGSTDALASAAGAYMDAIYSDSDKLALAQQHLSDSFDQLGVLIPQNADAYRQLVDAQDRNTEAGAALWSSLVKLGPAYAEVQKATEQAAQAERERAKDVVAGLAARSRPDTLAQVKVAAAQSAAQIRETIMGLRAAAWANKDQNAWDAAVAVGKAGAGLMLNSKPLTGMALELQRVRDTAEAMRPVLVEFYGGLYQANKIIPEAIKQQTAVLKSNFLGDVSDQLLKLKDSSAYAAAQLKAEQEQRLADAKALGLTGADLKKVLDLNAAQTAAVKAQKLADAWGSVGDTITDEIKRIRGLAVADSSTGYAAAAAQFATATATARAGDAGAASTLAGLSQSMLAAYADRATSAADLASVRGSTAASLERTQQVLHALGIPGFATGGLFGGGLRLVGEKGPELEVTGPARYYSAAQTRQLLAGGAGGDAAVAELKGLRSEFISLRREVAAFRSEQRGIGTSVAHNTRRGAEVLERVAPDGDAIATRAAE